MAVVAVIALLVVWQSLRRGNGTSRSELNSTQVAARSMVTPETSPAAVEPPSSEQTPAPGVSPETTGEKSPSNGVTTKEASLSPAFPTSQVDDDAQPELVPSTPPAPPPLKLQAVFWNPKRPSAIITGKTVFVDDRIQDFKVTKITQDSATLSKSGETKELRITQ
jgi:hypothetical protein